MRIVILGAIPLICAILGWLVSIKFAESQAFWEKFAYKHEKIKSDIAFLQNPLSEILETGFETDGKKDYFSILANDYFKNGKTTQKLKFLSAEETAFIEKYLQNLGTTDKDSQINLLKSMETEIKKYSETSYDKCKKYRPLYIKLGFLAGLVIFILVV
nr:hypothetical protein [Clostridia bacterium]